MPGRVLVVDPIVTNRIVLKAQLSAEYFRVDTCSALDNVLQTTVRINPDAIVMRFEDERASRFATCKALRQHQLFSDIPILLLAPEISQHVWQAALQADVDEVLVPALNQSLLIARLEQLIRRRRSQNETHRRFQTELECSNRFALHETGARLDHAPRKFLTCDLSQANRAIPQIQRDWMGQQLNRVFEKIFFDEARSNTADVTIVHLGQAPDDRALRKLVERRQALQGKNQRLLAIAGDPSRDLVTQLLKLGADDVLFAPFSVAELAVRLRRLGRDLHRDGQVDVSLAKQMRQAVRDPLTGLYNRRYAFRHLKTVTDAAQPHTAIDLAVMMLDIDRFKSVNDTFGHAGGDQVLREVARRLTSNLRAEDMVARIGGEEFLIVLSDLSRSRLEQVAERVREAISERPILLDTRQKASVSVSVGVANATIPLAQDTDLLAQADQALYASKNNGRNRVSFAQAAA